VKSEELEALVKSLQNQVSDLQDQTRTLRDIEEIKKLQRAYGYYIDNFMTDEIASLFSDRSDTVLKVHAGEFHGKAGVKRFFTPKTHSSGIREKGRRIPGFLHQVMQLSPIIDIAPDGNTAKGRWYGFGANATPVSDGIYHGWMDGVYENDYIKENGVWKIWKLSWWMYFFAPYSVGWVEAKDQCDKDFRHQPPKASPDAPADETLYPSTYICPFHFNHPVTAQPTPVVEEKK
jgi:hypothetical protein